MTLSYIPDTINTGSLIYLSDEFVDWVSHLPHNIQEGAFWHGMFRVNVIPYPCEGEEVKEYRVEFFEHPEGKTRKGFALRMYPDNTMVDQGGHYTPSPGTKVIGRKVA